jgi:hypothetical protein
MARWLLYDQVALCLYLAAVTMLGVIAMQVSPHGLALALPDHHLEPGAAVGASTSRSRPTVWPAIARSKWPSG